jgi:hypothetical protein
MGLETYRVRREFGWDGWLLAPEGACSCPCDEDTPCTGQNGTGCNYCERTDHCSCRIDPDRYGGDIWIVMEGHPRKEAILAARFAVSDPSLPPAEELIKDDRFKRLLTMWMPLDAPKPRRQVPRVADPVA